MNEFKDRMYELLGQMRALVENEPDPPRPIGILEKFTFYSQKDPAWASLPLGPDGGPVTIGSHGCLLCCAAMSATYRGRVITPLELNRWLSECGGFVSETGNPQRTLLVWEKLASLNAKLAMPQGFPARKEWPGGKPADLAFIRNALMNPLVIEVDFNVKTAKLDQHFVVGLEMVEQGDIVIADPWVYPATPRLLSDYFSESWRRHYPEDATIAEMAVCGVRLFDDNTGV